MVYFLIFGLLLTIFGFLILVINWLNISEIINSTILIEYWIDIAIGYVSFSAVLGSPHSGFIFGIIILCIGVFITIISSIGVGLFIREEKK